MRRFALFVALIWAATALAADISFPPLTGRIVDQANVLSPAAEAELDQRLAAHERATHQQVVVATVPTLQGQTIEDYGYRLGRAWGIGEKDKNTGAILLVAPNERAVRIEVGYGLEGVLTDAQSRVIIERNILPEFRAGRLEAGVIQGAGAILAVLGGDAAGQPQAAVPLPQRDPGGLPPIAFIIFFVILMFVLRRRRRIGFLPFILPGPGIWRSGGGSGGGFSGGGGSFGGGGASGSW